MSYFALLVTGFINIMHTFSQYYIDLVQCYIDFNTMLYRSSTMLYRSSALLYRSSTMSCYIKVAQLHTMYN